MTGLPAKTLHDAAEQLLGTFVDTGVVDEIGSLNARLSGTPAQDALVGSDAFVLPVRSEAVHAVGVALGVTGEPIALEAEDERTARVVAVVVGPYRDSSTFLQTVSSFARELGRSEISDPLAHAESHDDAVAACAGFGAVELPGYLTVGDVMNKRPRSVWPDATLAEVARVMVANRISSIPVTSEHGEILGIVTHRDVLRMTLPNYVKRLSAGSAPGASEEDVRKIPAREVMDRSVLCVSEEQTLADVASILTGKEIDRVPVIREGVLVGLLTRADIVRRLFGP